MRMAASWLIAQVYSAVRRRRWHPTPVLLPGKSHGRRSLVGCSPWGCEESDTTERLHFHFSLSCVGEGNGNPLQCSCLENPRDGGAWWAAVYGVSQSRTWLKRLSSSSSNSNPNFFILVLTWYIFSHFYSSSICIFILKFCFVLTCSQHYILWLLFFNLIWQFLVFYQVFVFIVILNKIKFKSAILLFPFYLHSSLFSHSFSDLF